MTFFISVQQVVIMFLLMGIGYFCRHINLISEQTTKDMTNVLLYIVSPCLIVNAFLQKFSWRRLELFFIVFATVIGVFLLAILIGKLVFTDKRVADVQKRAVLRYGAPYSNAGFMGAPLVQAILGKTAVFFAVPYLVVYNIFMWTHGVGLFKKTKDIRQNLKEALLNPNVIASLVGLLLFITQIHLPDILVTTIHQVVNLNTPLSMIIIGTNLGAVKWKQLANDRFIWQGVFVRNILVPGIVLLVLIWLPLNTPALMATLIMVSCPVSGTAVLFSLLNDYDLEFPTKLMCLSTVFSIASLPLLILCADLLLQI